MSHKEELLQREQPQRRPGRKKKDNVPETEQVGFKLTLDLIERLGYYAVRCTRAEHRNVTKSEIVEGALDEFLRGKGF